MSSDLSAELSAILQAVRIHSLESFSFAGEAPVHIPSYAVPHGLPSVEPKPGAALIAALTGVLYHRCYSQAFGPQAPVANAGQPVTIDPGFINRLTQANGGRERWDAGWRIYQTLPNAQLLVQKGEVSRSALPGEYILNPPGQARPGQEILIRVVPEAKDLQPGFYFCFSETLSDQFDDFDLIRLYFNTPASAAPSMLGALSWALNRFEVPFRLKCLSAPDHYYRTDSMVLYFAKRHFQIVAELLATMPGPVLAQLNGTVPLFSKSLRPGIGLAEDPGTGESFGMHRCRLLAEGLLEAWKRGEHSDPGRLGSVRRQFAIGGISLDAPHLNAGSVDFFDLPRPIAIAV